MAASSRAWSSSATKSATAFAAGEASPLPPIEVHYRDFARRQRNELQGDVLADHLAYWRRPLAGAPEVLPLPTDHRRPAAPSFRGWAQPFTVPPEVAAGLRSLARSAGASPFMTLLAAFKVFLYRHTGQADMVVGAPVANRTSPDYEPLIGFFVNTLILRSDASGGPTFREYLGQVRDVALNAYAHEHLPFERIVEDLQPERDLSRNPLFQVVFTLQAAAQADHAAPEPPPDGLPLAESQTAKFDITLGMAEVGDHMGGALECSADLFDAETVTRLARRFVVLLSSVVEDPDRSIDRLAVMDEDERTTVLDEWNRTGVDFPEACFHELFERQADATPDAVAAEAGTDTLTYRQLDERANRLARTLIDAGIGAGDPVAIHLERGVGMVEAVLGVLKTGGMYVPVDLAQPEERMRAILSSAGARHLVTDSGQLDAVEAVGDLLSTVVCLDGAGGRTLGSGLRLVDRAELDAAPAGRVGVAVDPGSLAYVIFTSGSTGQPKGVMVRHRPVINLIEWVNGTFEIGPGDRLLFITSLSFDLSVYDVFGILAVVITGGVPAESRAVNQRPAASRASTASKTPRTTAGASGRFLHVRASGRSCGPLARTSPLAR